MNEFLFEMMMYFITGLMVAGCPMLYDWYKQYKTKDAEYALFTVALLLWPLVALWGVLCLLFGIGRLTTCIRRPFVVLGRGLADVWRYHSLMRGQARLRRYHAEQDAELPEARVIKRSKHT